MLVTHMALMLPSGSITHLASWCAGVPWTLIQCTAGPASCWAVPGMPSGTCPLPGTPCSMRWRSAQSMLTPSATLVSTTSCMDAAHTRSGPLLFQAPDKPDRSGAVSCLAACMCAKWVPLACWNCCPNTSLSLRMSICAGDSQDAHTAL